MGILPLGQIVTVSWTGDRCQAVVYDAAGTVVHTGPWATSHYSAVRKLRNALLKQRATTRA